jgi:hypothetical protein
MISQRPIGVWSQIFENRLLAVVEAEAEAEADEGVRLSTGELGVSNSSLSFCDSISRGCEAILVTNQLSVRERSTIVELSSRIQAEGLHLTTITTCFLKGILQNESLLKQVSIGTSRYR